MNIRQSLITRATEYFEEIPELSGKQPPMLLVDFVIEKYKQHRNFPNGFSEQKINKDMADHLATMAMAVVDLYMKSGAEGEVSHSENGISRAYENAYISSSIFSDVLPFVKIL